MFEQAPHFVAERPGEDARLIAPRANGLLHLRAVFVELRGIGPVIDMVLEPKPAEHLQPLLVGGCENIAVIPTRAVASNRIRTDAANLRKVREQFTPGEAERNHRAIPGCDCKRPLDVEWLSIHHEGKSPGLPSDRR
jgi:hypothetical protein